MACGAYKQLHNHSARVCESGTDISQGIEVQGGPGKQRKMCDDRILGEDSLPLCACEGRLAEAKDSLTGSDLIIYDLMDQVDSFSFYPVVSSR